MPSYLSVPVGSALPRIISLEIASAKAFREDILPVMASDRKQPEDHVSQILVAWQRECPELDTSSIAVIGRILRAARYLSSEIEKELAAFDLSIPELNALLALRRAGEPYELSATELGNALLFSSGGLTKLVERLDRSGYVTREQNPDDRRVVRIRLTRRGRELQEEAIQAHLLNQDELLAPLTAEARDALAAALRELLFAFESGFGRDRPLVRASAGP